MLIAKHDLAHQFKKNESAAVAGSAFSSFSGVSLLFTTGISPGAFLLIRMLHRNSFLGIRPTGLRLFTAFSSESLPWNMFQRRHDKDAIGENEKP